MKIAVLQASSQKDKNSLLYECVKQSAPQGEVLNFGVFSYEEEVFSYVEIALCISFLLESGSVDFVVIGCSSGQGMMLACNSLPGVICGYCKDASDAYLFGRINDGNAISFPLGLHFGWGGELNLQITLDQLFHEPFGSGYPSHDAKRKQQDTALWKSWNRQAKCSLVELLATIDEHILQHILTRTQLFQYILDHGVQPELHSWIKLHMKLSI